ncbi:MAG: HlyD family efflux transporter periplasmic adaptor subunit [Clostridia bacterium]|nr:HlyD family efflux transporter periplasmic adaptor subunit [Clostridia bacterium]
MIKRDNGTPAWLKWLGRGVMLIVLAAAGLVGWNYLEPLVNSEAIPIYESFTVTQGDIETNLSYSATISIINRQTVSGSMAVMASRTTVRSIDVEENQMVEEGDQLAQLSNGEVLTAEIDGVVNAINYSVGDRVRGNASIMDICDFENLQMTMLVDEYDIDSLQAGQACTVTVLPLGLSFETQLEHINRFASGTGSVAYYQVTAKIDAPANVLPGMQASVSFPDQRVKDVTKVDINALAFREDGSAYVLKANAEGGYDEQNVQTGLSDGLQVEIISGLTPGETVWAQTGTREAEPAFTLESLYKQLMGETVIINDRTNRGNNRGGMGQLHEGAETSQRTPGGENRQRPGQPEGDASRSPETEQGGNPDAT